MIKKPGETRLGPRLLKANRSSLLSEKLKTENVSLSGEYSLSWWINGISQNHPSLGASNYPVKKDRSDLLRKRSSFCESSCHHKLSLCVSCLGAPHACDVSLRFLFDLFWCNGRDSNGFIPGLINFHDELCRVPQKKQ